MSEDGARARERERERVFPSRDAFLAPPALSLSEDRKHVPAPSFTPSSLPPHSRRLAELPDRSILELLEPWSGIGSASRKNSPAGGVHALRVLHVDPEFVEGRGRDTGGETDTFLY